MKTKTISIISSLIGIAIGGTLIAFSKQLGTEGIIIAGTYITIISLIRAIEDIIKSAIQNL